MQTIKNFVICCCLALSVFVPSLVRAQTQDQPFTTSPFETNQQQPIFPQTKAASRRITPPSGSSKEKSTDSTDKQKAGGLGSIWTTLGSLALVVGLILLIAKLFKKNGGLSSGGLPREAIEVLGRQPIDARQSIHLIRLGSRILVVGSAPEGMTTLTEIDDPVEVDYLAGVCQSNQEKSPFTNAFRTFFTHTQNDDQQTPHTDNRRESSAHEVPPDQGLVNQFASRTPPIGQQRESQRESIPRRNQPHG